MPNKNDDKRLTKMEREQYRLRVQSEQQKFDYIGFNMRNQTHDPEINANRKKLPTIRLQIFA